MRIFVLVILLVLLIAVVVRAVIAGNKPSWITVSLITAPLLFLGWGEYSWQNNQSIGSEVVVMVSDNPEGELKCQRFTEALLDASVATKGFVYFSESNVATIKYNTCQDLFGWFNGNRQAASLLETQALGVLIHEAVHVSGEFNEAITECLSMKQMEDVLEYLGTSSTNAKVIAEQYRTKIHVNLRSEYLGGEC